jgi:hypothetical protein
MCPTTDQPIIWEKVFAWFAVAICISLSARGATVYAKNSPRVFTILALFALNWALLIPYYSLPNPPELLASFAGFLLVYIGVLLRREARSNSLNENNNEDSIELDENDNEDVIEKAEPSINNATIIETSVHRGDRIALWLLGLLIAPSLISLPFVHQLSFLNRSYTEPILGSTITIIGYYSLWSAMRIYSSQKFLQWVLFVIISIYSVIEVTFTTILVIDIYKKSGLGQSVQNTVEFWCKPPEYPMDENFLILFAIMKLVFVPLVIYLVLHESISEEDRKLTLADKILKLFGVL